MSPCFPAFWRICGKTKANLVKPFEVSQLPANTLHTVAIHAAQAPNNQKIVTGKFLENHKEGIDSPEDEGWKLLTA